MRRAGFGLIAACFLGGAIGRAQDPGGPDQVPPPPVRVVEPAGDPFSDEPSPPSIDAATLAKLEASLPKLDAIQPLPEPSIPDDPPPHEGALIDRPLRISPPDLLLVDVLEALPGRPISGERLVRPDGTISLGFYGDVHVRGLTPSQAKVKVILSLRGILNDEALGLIGSGPDGGVVLIPPERSDRVLVDIAGYNSGVYYIQGDVAAPGRLPFTGNETVLDALQHAGGLLPTADRTSLVLVRPARGDRPARIYAIDFDAIVDRGDPRTNLQVFPGDRILVERVPPVPQTPRVDPASAPKDAEP